MIDQYTSLALAIYFLVLLLITYFSSKREGFFDFLIASKNQGWKAIGLSTFASAFSSYNIILLVTFAFLFGVHLFVVYLGIFLAFAFIYHIMKRTGDVSFKNKFINILDYFSFKYGRAVTTIINLILLFVLFFFIILQINVNTLVFSNLLGVGKLVAAFSVVLIVVFYITLGGVKTEIKTDIFQGILMLAFISLAFMVDTSSITAQNVMANLSDTATFFSAVALAILQFITLIVQPEIWQRVYATKDLKNLKWGFIFASVLIILITVPIVIVGLVLKYGGGVTDVGNAFYEVIKLGSPAWFFPIIMVALFAAFMSTLDSSIMAMSSQLAKRQFIVGVKDEFAERRLTRNTRWWIIGISTLAMVLSLTISDFLTGVFQLISIATVAGTFFIMSILLKPSKKEIIVSLILGIAAFIVATFTGLITQDPWTALYPSIFMAALMVLQRLFVKNIFLRKNKNIHHNS